MRSDGVWSWAAGLAHHVRHHHFGLPVQMLCHIRSRNYSPPTKAELLALGVPFTDFPYPDTNLSLHDCIESGFDPEVHPKSPFQQSRSAPNTVRIGVAGAPSSGRITLLKAISARSGGDAVWEPGESDAITTLILNFKNVRLEFVSLHGELIKSGMSTDNVINYADLGLFVIDSGEERRGVMDQQLYLACYEESVFRIRRGWEGIPWLFVLNKVDQSSQNPLKNHIPELYRNKVLNVAAITGIGIDELIKQIWKSALMIRPNLGTGGPRP